MMIQATCKNSHQLRVVEVLFKLNVVETPVLQLTLRRPQKQS